MPSTRVVATGADETVPFGEAPTAVADLPPFLGVDEVGGEIGGYRIRGVLGAGGMGVVYLAEQRQPVEREVAIKVVGAARLDRDAVLRFAAERQALARLEHPHIARLYEAGTTAAGRPFFVMELAQGEPILDWCDRRRLGIDERLDLFLAVCEGVHHAHQKGVVHRDLKPSNILVTELEGRPVPKIIDFGVAKALDRPLVAGMQTTAGAIVGTPAYLAPEAFGDRPGDDVDIRSDVYSLGVVLYELLAGLGPFDLQRLSLAAFLLESARRERPAPSLRLAALEPEAQRGLAAGRGLTPTAHQQRLRGDLDWIVGRAVAIERERRYGSVSDLAADLRRARRDEPVLAGPPSAAYRLGKLVRRHRTVFAVVALLAASLVAGVVARSLEARRANREAAAAIEARAEAEQTVDFLLDVFSLADPEEARGRKVTAEELLARGAQRLGDEALAGTPLVRARLLEAISTAELHLGLPREALPHATESLRLRQREAGTDPLALARTLDLVGGAAFDAGQPAVADAFFRRAAALYATLPSADPVALAANEGHRAMVAYRRGDHDLAAELYSSAAAREARLGPSRRESLAERLSSLGLVRAAQGRVDEAIALHRQAIELLESEPGSQLARSLHNLATTYLLRNRAAEAEPLLRRALEIRERILGPRHPIVARLLVNLAKAETLLDRFDEAREKLERALAVRVEALGPDHPDVAFCHSELGHLAERLGRGEEAERHYRRALAIWKARYGPDHRLVGYPLAALGILAAERGDLPAGERDLRRAAVVLADADPVDLAWVEWGLGCVLRDRGAYAEAEILLRRSLEVRARELPAGDAEIQESRQALDELLRRTGRTAPAATTSAGA